MKYRHQQHLLLVSGLALVALPLLLSSFSIIVQAAQTPPPPKQGSNDQRQSTVQRPSSSSKPEQEHETIHRDQAGRIASQSQANNDGPQSTARPVRHLTHGHHGDKTIVDLSYPLHDGTLYWPSVSGFQYRNDVDEERKSPKGETFHLKSDGFTMAVHTGTHLDAPRHFSKDGLTVDKIPLEQLIDIPVTVIDVSEKVKLNRTYNIVKDDLLDPQTKEPLVQARSVLLAYTGISQYYDQGRKAYFGTEGKNYSEIKIPGFSKEAAQYLVERQVFGVGLDSPSADSSDRHEGFSGYDPQAHVAFSSANVYIIENINSKLKELIGLPSARLTIAPLAIRDGSGSPIRLVAIAGHDECDCPLQNGANSNLMAFSISPALAVAVFIVAHLAGWRNFFSLTPMRV